MVGGRAFLWLVLVMGRSPSGKYSKESWGVSFCLLSGGSVSLTSSSSSESDKNKEELLVETELLCVVEGTGDEKKSVTNF